MYENETIVVNTIPGIQPNDTTKLLQILYTTKQSDTFTKTDRHRRHRHRRKPHYVLENYTET